MARFLDYLLLGLKGVLRHKLRSALTALGVVLGIAALLSMMAVGEGARRQLLEEMSRMGLHNIILKSKRAPKAAAEKKGQDENKALRFGLTFKDLERCKVSVPGLIRALPVHEVHSPVVMCGRKINARVLGVTQDYFRTFPARLECGRALADMDAGYKHPVCVLTPPLPREVLQARNPVGMIINVGTKPFRVVGVVTPHTALLDLSEGENGKHVAQSIGQQMMHIFIPYRTVLDRFGTISIKAERGKFERFKLELDEIILECEDPIAALKPLDAVLKKGHKEMDYEVTVPVELLRHRRKTQETFNLVILLVAALTLTVGGVGIVNIMLVSVAERTKEIGIRRALGARRRDIMQQFLVETISLTLVGGMLGLLVGFGGVYGIEAYTGWPVAVTPKAVVGGLLVSVVAGVLFGLYPAHKAASTHPAVSLRYE